MVAAGELTCRGSREVFYGVIVPTDRPCKPVPFDRAEIKVNFREIGGLRRDVADRGVALQCELLQRHDGAGGRVTDDDN